VLRQIVAVIEGNDTYRSRNPKGEPQLGRYGLYGPIGGQRTVGYSQLALLWVLNLADGEHSLLDTAERARISFSDVRAAADALLAARLIEPVHRGEPKQAMRELAT
jgi:aminopeptidase-like protein